MTDERVRLIPAIKPVARELHAVSTRLVATVSDRTAADLAPLTSRLQEPGGDAPRTAGGSIRLISRAHSTVDAARPDGRMSFETNAFLAHYSFE